MYSSLSFLFDVHHCYFRGVSIGWKNIGFDANFGSTLAGLWNECEFQGCARGIVMARIRSSVFNQCTFENCDYEGALIGRLEGVTFISPHFEQNGRVGCTVKDADFVIDGSMDNGFLEDHSGESVTIIESFMVVPGNFSREIYINRQRNCKIIGGCIGSIYADREAEGYVTGVYFFPDARKEIISSKFRDFTAEEEYHGATETLTLQNGWTMEPGIPAPKAARRAEYVYLSGGMRSGTNTDGTTLFTISNTTLRPASGNVRVPVIYSNSGIYEVGAMTIQPDGQAKIYGVSGNTWLSLEGISYKVSG